MIPVAGYWRLAFDILLSRLCSIISRRLHFAVSRGCLQYEVFLSLKIVNVMEHFDDAEHTRC